MIKCLWLAVTGDELELPFAVADTAGELAVMLGVSRSCITIAATRTARHESVTRKIYKIELDKDFLKELEKEF